LVLVGLHLVMRWLGLATTTAMLSGTSTSPSEMVIGAVYVLVSLLAWIVGPCLLLGSAFEAIFWLRRLRALSPLPSGTSTEAPNGGS
jgi:hypothetical protein